MDQNLVILLNGQSAGAHIRLCLQLECLYSDVGSPSTHTYERQYIFALLVLSSFMSTFEVGKGEHDTNK